jgi:hypothetical protein
MRIRKERLESNIRTSQLEADMAKVISNTEDLYVEEVLLALNGLQAYWINVLRNDEIPSIEKESDEESNEGSTT